MKNGGDAVLNYDAIITYDGINDPIVINESVTLPTAPNDDERFTLGKWTIGGIVIDQIRSMDLEFGISVQTEGADSDIWETHANISRISPSIRLRGINLNWLRSAATAKIPLLGQAAIHTDTTGYLRKRKDGGTFELDGNAVHIKMTAAGYARIDTGMDASGDSSAECSLVLDTIYDGTNAPIVFDTSASIV